eukprot:1372838-Rhodomonas_salina.2
MGLPDRAHIFSRAGFEVDSSGRRLLGNPRYLPTRVLWNARNCLCHATSFAADARVICMTSYTDLCYPRVRYCSVRCRAHRSTTDLPYGATSRNQRQLDPVLIVVRRRNFGTHFGGFQDSDRGAKGR